MQFVEGVPDPGPDRRANIAGTGRGPAPRRRVRQSRRRHPVHRGSRVRRGNVEDRKVVRLAGPFKPGARRPHSDPASGSVKGDGLFDGHLSHRRAFCRNGSAGKSLRFTGQWQARGCAALRVGDFVRLIGYKEIWDFEKKCADLLAEPGMAANR
jgi:hypothetical protein